MASYSLSECITRPVKIIPVEFQDSISKTDRFFEWRDAFELSYSVGSCVVRCEGETDVPLLLSHEASKIYKPTLDGEGRV